MNRRGSSLIEFTLVGIPLIFVLIGIFEMARGMWLYHTMAHAIKAGTRFASVHGRNCRVLPNDCAVTVAQISERIRQAGLGLPPAELSLQFKAYSGTLNCSLADCLNDTTVWPESPGDAPGRDIEITATFPFRSAIAMFWPGGGAVNTFAAVNLPASSRERIQF
jgi:hypothetical protein